MPSPHAWLREAERRQRASEARRAEARMRRSIWVGTLRAAVLVAVFIGFVLVAAGVIR
jgi:hypothetical protein